MKLLESKTIKEVNDNKELFSKHIELYEKSKLKTQKMKDLNSKIYGQFNYKPLLNNSNKFLIRSSFQERQDKHQMKLRSKQIEY